MPTKDKKIIGQDLKAESLIRREWSDFSKTTAYREMMQFAKVNDDNLIHYAKDLAMPGPTGEVITISGEMSNYLLQRAAGIGIITSYIRLYSE